MERKVAVGGSLGGYVDARVVRMVLIWAHGAAQGAWKDSTRSVDGEAEERIELKFSSLLTSVSSLMVAGMKGSRDRIGLGKGARNDLKSGAV